jgi:single-stranded-DNA-specific exonuclease
VAVPDPPGLAARFRRFLDRLAPGRPVAVLCHNDADGLTAGALLTRGLGQLGHTVAVECTRKGENAWVPAVRDRLAPHQPQALFVADLGTGPKPILPGVPTLFLDHHVPEGLPPGAELLTGYGLEPTPTSGLLSYWCLPVAALDWVAAVSILSDLGDTPDFAELTAAKQRYRLKTLREATTLLNAPRRASGGDARPALDLLLTANHPLAVTRGRSPAAQALRDAKAEVGAALAEARRAAPLFSGDVALVRMHSPCQVHPLIAQMWRNRLAKHIVLAANTGYLPEQVNFSARTAGGVNLIAFLAQHAPADAGDAYGHGHDQASGGSLKPAAWNEFITRLGFGPEACVPVPGKVAS